MSDQPFTTECRGNRNRHEFIDSTPEWRNALAQQLGAESEVLVIERSVSRDRRDCETTGSWCADY